MLLLRRCAGCCGTFQSQSHRPETTLQMQHCREMYFGHCHLEVLYNIVHQQMGRVFVLFILLLRQKDSESKQLCSQNLSLPFTKLRIQGEDRIKFCHSCNLDIQTHLQAVHSLCSQPPVHIITKVLLLYETHVLKRNLCFGVNKRLETT